MKLWSWEINSAASRKVWTFNYVESSASCLCWQHEHENENENENELFQQLSTFQFMCSSAAVSYTQVINDGTQTTTATRNHFQSNVKNNSKFFRSTLSFADGYLILNTHAQGSRGVVGVRLDKASPAHSLTDLRQQLIELMEDGSCRRRGNGDG